MAKRAHRVLQKIDALNEEAWKIRSSDTERSRVLAEQAMALVESLQKTMRGERYTIGYASALCILAYYAMKVDDYPTARARAETALVLFEELHHDTGCARMRFVLGFSDLYQGLCKTAIEYFTTGLSLLEREPDPLLQLSMLNNLGAAYLGLADHPKAIEYMERTLAAAQYISDMDMIAGQMLNLGAVYAQMGEGEKGLKYLLQFLALSENIEISQNDIAMAYTNIGLIVTWAGDYGSALEYFRRSLAIREEIGDAVPIAETYTRIGSLYLTIKEYAPALPCLLKSLSVYEQQNIHRGIALCLTNLAAVELGLGNGESGLQYAQRSATVSQQTGDRYVEYHALIAIGDAYCRTNKWEEAVTAYTDALTIVCTLDDVRGKAAAYRSLIVLYTNAEELVLAQKYGRKALALLEKVDEKPIVRDIHKALTTLYERMGKAKKELEHYKAFYAAEQDIRNEQSSRQMCLMKVLHGVEETKKEAENYRVRSSELELRVEKQNKELVAKALSLSERGELLHKVQKELQEACRGPKSKLEHQIRGVAMTISTALAADHTWNAFEELFTKVHNSFITVLKEQYPALSNTELKVCALIKINLSSKEVSRLLHVSVSTVETYRHRIRKKVGLSPQETLMSFLTRVN